MEEPSRTTVRHRSGSASTSHGLVFTAIVAARSAGLAFARPAASENTTSGSAARTAAARGHRVGEVDLAAGQADHLPAVPAQPVDEMAPDESPGPGDERAHARRPARQWRAGRR